MAVDPHSPNTVYAGADSGLFKSVDAGATWTEVGRGFLYAAALAIDPVNPDTVYLGTGFNGLYRTVDGGNTWWRVEAGLTDHYIYSLAVDPRDPSTVWAGTRGGGIFRRTFVRPGPDPVPATDIGKMALVISHLDRPAQSLALKGTIRFGSSLPVPPLDVASRGMRVRIEDVPTRAVALDITVPGGAKGSGEHCGALDGWTRDTTGRSQVYKNRSSEILPPQCTAGSAAGVTKAVATDKTSRNGGAKFVLTGRNGKYAAGAGPFRITVVLGGPSEEAAGQAGQHTFSAGDCAVTGTTLRCRTPS